MKKCIAFFCLLAAACMTSCGVTNSAKMSSGSSSGIAQSVEGKLGGVMLDSAPGNPESSPQLLLRGLSSINAGTNMLIVLDGMPYDGPLSGINPNDIRSVKVLKDPIDTVIYGFRGSNGVIVIETKTSGSRSYSDQKKK